MLYRPLRLARIICRLDFRPKSILYYANRADIAALYYPSPYADWQYGPTSLRQISQDRRVRLTFEGEFVALEADTPEGIPGLQSHFLEVVERTRHQLMGNAKPSRLGWRVIFVLEHSSFDELFPVFNTNTTAGASDWIRIPGRQIRDSAFVLYYGKENDGLNLNMGVLTPAQASKLRDALEFRSPPDLAIDNGTLMIDFDRFSTTATTLRAMKDLLNEHKKLEETANNLAQALLQDVVHPGEKV